jgi:RNA polymerase primary sigma factor
LIEDKSSESPAARVITSNLREIAGDVLQTLSPREERVIRLRFGLDNGGHERTLEEVGQNFNVTRERIRQNRSESLAQAASSIACAFTEEFPRRRGAITFED